MSRKAKARGNAGPTRIFIGARVSTQTALTIDTALERLHIDRPRFLRRALEEKMAGRPKEGASPERHERARRIAKRFDTT